MLFCWLCNNSSSDYRYSQFVSFIVNIDVSKHSVNAQQTNYVPKNISPVLSFEIKAMIQLGLNMLALIPLFAIFDRRLAMNSQETCDRIMSLQNTSNHVHLIVRWVNIPSYRRRVLSIVFRDTKQLTKLNQWISLPRFLAVVFYWLMVMRSGVN